MKAIIFIVVFLTIEIQISAQDSCRVMVRNLEGSYTGKCKKGLAHGYGEAVGKDRYNGYFKKGFPNGKGIYIWANGDVYEGNYTMGVREGEGKFTSASKNLIQDGVWKNDAYTGPKPMQPRIIEKQEIISANFTRQNGDEKQITIMIVRANVPLQYDDLFILNSSGNEFKNGNNIGFNNISFPFKCRIEYKCWNVYNTVQYNCKFEFEIEQPGNWELRLLN